MGRRNNGLLDEFFEFARERPKFGLVVAGCLALVAVYLEFLRPGPSAGLASLWAMLLGLLAGIFLVAAGLGSVGQIVNRLSATGRGRVHAVPVAQAESAASAATAGFPQSLDQIEAHSWQQFERLVAELFRQQGFHVEERGGQSDGGVDLVLHATGGAVHLVQCKQYRAWSVGVRLVREFYGAMAAFESKNDGFIVTCGRFTQEARDFARGKPLRLIDGEQLLDWIRAANAEPPQTSAALPSSATATADVPACPRCHVPMVRRTAQTGPLAGRPFFGCRNFPRCRQTIDIAE